MKNLIQFFLVVWSALGGATFAQSAYAGSYNSMAGYSSGPSAGYFGYGTTTVSRSGSVIYTEYWPAFRNTDRGTGRVDANGRIILTGGVSGSALIYQQRLAYGSFRDSYGRGFFAISKR